MPVYYNDIICITVDEWLNAGLSYALYKSDKKRNYLKIIRRGCNNNSALIEWDTLRTDRKEAIVAALGDPRKLVHRAMLEDYIKPDHEAAAYFANYLLPDGRKLDLKSQKKYLTEACLLNAIKAYITETRTRRKAIGMRKGEIYTMAANLLAQIDTNKYPHDLPTNPRRLKDRLKKYIDNGYESLIHGNWCNRNSRKVNELVEKLLISIYCMDNLPFGEWVHDYYLQFLSGALQVVDAETGELFNRNEFRDKNGDYIVLSASTIWNVLNKPDNQALVDRLRNNRIDHITLKTPHNHRKSPQYSLSKISMDDRTLPRKTTDGKWVNLYYAFDVASGCVLGVSISTDKPNHAMVRDCMADMYRFIVRHNLKWPAELECENHLMRDIEDSLHRLFPFVTFTTPGISRSKRAEHMIHGKKYGDEKNYQEGIGRWNAKGKAYKIKSPNKDEDYKQPRLPLEQIIADEYESIRRYNNEPHPFHNGKTRWQVLMENPHPQLMEPNPAVILREIGNKTATSLRNNDYLRVQYENYAIESYGILSKLQTNNYNVDAYYLPGENGEINEVFIYQGDTYLGRATRIERYQEAKIERNERDEQIRIEQSKRQAMYHSMEKKLKQQKFRKVKIIRNENNDISDLKPIIIDTSTLEPDNWDELSKPYDIAALAKDSL